MKKLISLILCIVMLLGQMPAMAFAAEEGGNTQNELPAGYGQLYVRDATIFAAKAGDGNNMGTPTTNGGSIVPSDFDFSVSDSKLGSVGVNGDSIWLLAHAAIPGTSGWFYAVSKTNENEKYALYVTIGQPDFGIYTSQSADPETYVPKSPQNNRLSVTYSDTERSVYLHPADGWCILESAIAYPTNLLSYEFNADTGVAAFALKDSVSGSFSVQISFRGGMNHWGTEQFRNYTFTINFTEAPPTGYGQLYIGGASVYKPQAGNNYTQLTYTANGSSITAVDFDFSFSNNKLGVVNVNNGVACLNTFSAIPGANGWLYAVSKSDPSVKYAISVSIDKPFVGMYTNSSIDPNDIGKNYVAPESYQKYTVNYTDIGRSVYLIPGSWIISANSISVNTDQVTVTLENGVLKVTLADECTDARVNAAISYTLEWRSNGQVTNSQKLTTNILFTDGSEDMSLYYNGSSYITGYAGELKGCAGLSLPTGGSFDRYTFSCDSSIGEVYWRSDLSTLVWSTLGVPAGATGKIYATKNGKTYSIDAAVEGTLSTVYFNGKVCAPVIRMYDNMPLYALTTTDNELTFDVKLREDINAADVMGAFTPNVSATIKNRVLLENNTIRFTMERSSQDTNLFLRTMVNGKLIDYRWYLRFDYTAFDSGILMETGNPNFYVIADVEPKSEAYTVAEEDVCGEYYESIAPLTINGTTYYMNVSETGYNYPQSVYPGPSASMSMFGMSMPRAISFFVKVGENEFQRVVAPEALAEIEAAIGGTLKLSIVPYDDSLETTFAPTVFPVVRVGSVMKADGTRDNSYFDCQGITILEENLGSYMYVASCELNGEKIACSRVETYGRTAEILRWSFIDSDPDEVFAEITSALASVSTPCDSISLVLPAGEITGYLELPENPKLKFVNIFGSRSGNMEDLDKIETTIRGGVINHGNYACQVTDVHFIGAGKNVQTWPENSPNAGKANKLAVTAANVIANINCCIVEGYPIAVEKSVSIQSSLLQNNETAICVDLATYNIVPSRILNNTFKGNTIAIDFKYLNPQYPLTSFDLTNNAFIDNGTDIRNGIGRNIFIPGCYFGATNESGEVEERECVYSPKAVGNAKKQVLYYPQATDMTFSDYIYDTRFYNKTGSQTSNQNPVVSVEFTKTFPIPAGYLDGATFDVMKGDTMLAKIGFLPQMRMMFRMTRAAAETFDATVEVERSADGKTITVTTQPFPSGKTATISVPCDESWKQAKVTTESGEELDATIADGYVSFVADAGGKFVLVETSSVTPPVVPPAAPSVTPDSSETVTNPDGSTTTNTSTSDGSKGNTTMKPDGSVEAEVQLSGAAIANAAAKGECVTLPIPEMTAGVDSESAPVITINTGVELPVRVEIPVREASIATVAVLVLPDGSEKIVKDCAPTEDGLELSVTDGAVVKVVDNVTHFDDVHDVEHWGEDAIDFASARELMQGVGGDSFSPDTTTTRGMVFTVLARYADHDTTTDAGVHWHVPGTDWAIANGVSDGSDPEDIVTREQIVTMLWRYAGSPAVSGSYDSFTDADEVSDWASAAVRWAVSIGLIRGRGENNIAPKDSATRAEFSQMLYKFCVR